MADHLVDIFDENYVYWGTALKSEAHQNGLWHRVFTCLLMDSVKGTVLLQKKVAGKYSFERPDYLDISVGGHYIAGEDVQDGIREFKEETGIDISFNDLVNLGIRKSVFSVGNYHCCEYQHIFLYDMNGVAYKLLGDKEEVAGFVEVKIYDFIKLLLGEINGIDGVQMDEEQRNITVNRNSIDPAYMTGDCFMLRLVIAAKRLMEGEEKKLIFW